MKNRNQHKFQVFFANPFYFFMGEQLGHKQQTQKFLNEKYLVVGKKQVIKVNIYDKNLVECKLIMQHVVLHVPNMKNANLI